MRAGATIVVGYDGSPPAQRALDWAAEEADRHGAAVRAVTCYSLPVMAEPWYVPPMVDLSTVHDEALRQVRAAVHVAAGAYPDAAFRCEALLGSPADRLVEAAEDADLLVVGTHGHAARSVWRLGSTAHAVARHAPCPVVIVPDVAPGPLRRRIVVGVDGSPASAAALRWACDEADACDAELLVVHVWNYAYATELGSPAGRDITRVDAALALEAAVRTARDRRSGPTVDALVEGDTADELIAKARTADLVVVGSRGRGALRSRIFGSVSHDVSAHSLRPTVIVHDAPATPDAHDHT